MFQKLIIKLNKGNYFAFHFFIYLISDEHFDHKSLCFLFIDSISYNDFCDIMRKEKPLEKDSLLKAFKCIDTNRDGFITHDELFRLLTKVRKDMYTTTLWG